MRHGTGKNNRKAPRRCAAMEIVASRPGRARTKPVERPCRASRDDSPFAIVDTVTGPMAGTFGLSDVWERGKL